jgi:hypothetical protein
VLARAIRITGKAEEGLSSLIVERREVAVCFLEGACCDISSVVGCLDMRVGFLVTFREIIGIRSVSGSSGEEGSKESGNGGNSRSVDFRDTIVGFLSITSESSTSIGSSGDSANGLAVDFLERVVC